MTLHYLKKTNQPVKTWSALEHTCTVDGLIYPLEGDENYRKIFKIIEEEKIDWHFVHFENYDIIVKESDPLYQKVQCRSNSVNKERVADYIKRFKQGEHIEQICVAVIIDGKVCYLIGNHRVQAAIGAEISIPTFILDFKDDEEAKIFASSLANLSNTTTRLDAERDTEEDIQVQMKKEWNQVENFDHSIKASTKMVQKLADNSKLYHSLSEEKRKDFKYEYVKEWYLKKRSQTEKTYSQPVFHRIYNAALDSDIIGDKIKNDYSDDCFIEEQYRLFWPEEDDTWSSESNINGVQQITRLKNFDKQAIGDQAGRTLYNLENAEDSNYVREIETAIRFGRVASREEYERKTQKVLKALKEHNQKYVTNRRNMPWPKYTRVLFLSHFTDGKYSQPFAYEWSKNKMKKVEKII